MVPLCSGREEMHCRRHLLADRYVRVRNKNNSGCDIFLDQFSIHLACIEGYFWFDLCFSVLVEGSLLPTSKQ